MLHVNISHTEYAQALKALQDACPDLWHVTIAIDFSADHAQSKIIRDFVGLIFTYHRVNTPWWGRFTLITDELINNAIEHGSSAGDIDSCLIESWRDQDGEFYINLEVHDTGTGKDAKTAEEMATVKEKHKKDNSNGTLHEKTRSLTLSYHRKARRSSRVSRKSQRWPCCTYRKGYTKKYLDRPFPLRKYLNTSDENWF
jgi:anti-sigma regulatory factor (Ser/Thr protein kinase)